MRIVILNGPNLNLLGQREPEIYGQKSFDEYFEELKKQFPELQLDFYQTNVEGELINRLHQEANLAHGIVLNAGGYTHTSVAIADAISATQAKVIEVHISNVLAREAVRKTSLIAEKCRGSISGLGLMGYELAIRFLIKN